MKLPKKHIGYLHGFDWLRAVMSFNVVASHVYLSGDRVSAFDLSTFAEKAPSFSDVFFFNFSISLFLQSK